MFQPTKWERTVILTCVMLLTQTIVVLYVFFPNSLTNTSSAKSESGMKPYAYVMYATDEIYSCAAMVLATSIKETKPRPDIDIVVIVQKPGVPDHIILRMNSMGLKTVEFPPLHYVSVAMGYYRDNLTKLRILQLYQYKRIIFLDNDSIMVKNMDHLFDLPDEFEFASPRAYWIKHQPFLNAQLMVVKPSPQIWQRAFKYFNQTAEQRWTDMDIVNLPDFQKHWLDLPPKYMILNSHWGDAPREPTVTNYGHRMAYDLKDIFAFHFSRAELGKPWMHSMEDVERIFHKDGFPIYKHWYSICDDVCRGPNADKPFITIPCQKRRLF